MAREWVRRFFMRSRPDLDAAREAFEKAKQERKEVVDRNAEAREECYRALVHRFTPVVNGHKEV